ncbi:MAG: ABC transporter ATP-binding protein [Oscillospiraceae bacterium]|nr:ABC transporter ATP-binding protein [Oscillospiraceae bacterium]
MSAILEVKGLVKEYPGFRLHELSFALEEGKITGFIGRNGAGKTTTLHSLLGFVAPDAGEIRFWGGEFRENEQAVKQRIGFVSAGMSFYTKKKLKTITAVTRAFYPAWDEPRYRDYLRKFALSEEKTPDALSNGMKIKYMLALALSHGAELLILDEPTSGLDPISREELTEIFLDLRDQGKTILFSTHITSDLDRTADNILYIADGAIRAEDSLEGFIGAYRLAEYAERPAEAQGGELLIGERRSRAGHTALVRACDAGKLAIPTRAANLEEIMVHLEKEGASC